MQNFPIRSLRKKSCPCRTSSMQLHQICGWLRQVGQDFFSQLNRKIRKNPWFQTTNQIIWKKEMNRYTLVEITDCMMLSNNNNDRRIGTQITQVRLADIWAWMEVCVKLQLHFESAPPISNSLSNIAQLWALRHFATWWKLMKMMIQENIQENIFLLKNTVRGIHRRQKMPQRLRCQDRHRVKRLSEKPTNPHLIILFHESSMKVPWKFHEIRDQHRFKIVLIQSQPALSQPRLGRFAGNARWRPPESAV